MALTEQLAREAISRIQSAAYDPAKWDDALAYVAKAAGGWGGQLIGLSLTRGLAFNFSSGFSSDAVEDFESSGGADPSINPRAAVMVRKGPAIEMPPRLLIDDDFIASQDRDRNEFYRHVLSRHDATNMAIGLLGAPEGFRHAVAVVRSKSQGAASPADLASLNVLTPHIARALDLQGRLEREGVAIAAGALEAVSVPAFICDGSGCVRYVSAAAEDMLVHATVVRLNSGQLQAVTARSDAELQAAMRAVTARGLKAPQIRSRVVALYDRDGTARVADVAQLPVHRNALRYGAVIMVALRAAKLRPGGAELMKKLYAVSTAEAAVALALTKGESLREIADARGVSRETIRNQIKSLFQKIGVDSQTNLVRAVAVLAGGLEG